jgi:antitoxin MazE
VTTDISRWGNSLAVRIPRALAEKARLAEGDTVTVEAADDGSLVIRPARARYSVDELVRGITRRNRHGETPWGAPVGNEPW